MEFDLILFVLLADVTVTCWCKDTCESLGASVGNHHDLSEDQMGFIRQRHSVTNIRRLLGLIHTPPSPCDPAEVVSLVAEKAFDRVEWATVRHATALDSVALYLTLSSCIHEHLMF